MGDEIHRLTGAGARLGQGHVDFLAHAAEPSR